VTPSETTHTETTHTETTHTGTTPKRHENHTPAWPPVSRAEPARSLVYVGTAGVWFQEDTDGAPGGQVRPPDFMTACDLLFEWDAIAWVAPDICGGLRAWLPDLLTQTMATRDARPHQQWCELIVMPDGGAVMATVHRLIRHHWCARHFVSASVTGRERGQPLAVAEDIRQWLRDQREIVTLLGVGTHPTPGGAGEHAMFQGWREHPDWPRQHRPCLPCVADLQRHGIGGRIETYAFRETFPAAWGVDLNGAYPSAAVRVPAGTARRIPESGRWHAGPTPAERLLMPLDAPPQPCATWFCRCLVRISADRPAGSFPFALRAPTTGEPDRILWPTEAGVYDTWLWREEAEAIHQCELAGDPISVAAMDGGWLWEDFTDHLAPWAHAMDRARDHASNAAVRGGVKLATVAAIGRLKMAYSRSVLVHDSEARPGDTPWAPPGEIETAWYVRTTFHDRGTPLHWSVYIYMATNLRIWRMACEERARGRRVIAVLTDCIITDARPDPRHWQWSRGLGTAKRQYYGLTRVCGPEWILSPGQLRTPGLTAERRERLMRTGERQRTGVVRKRGPADVTRADRRESERREFRDAMRTAFLDTFARLEHAVDTGRTRALGG
jgi:hypothetical protein